MKLFIQIIQKKKQKLIIFLLTHLLQVKYLQINIQLKTRQKSLYRHYNYI
jgi:hypothetical protein